MRIGEEAILFARRPKKSRAGYLPPRRDSLCILDRYPKLATVNHSAAETQTVDGTAPTAEVWGFFLSAIALPTLYSSMYKANYIRYQSGAD